MEAVLLPICPVCRLPQAVHRYVFLSHPPRPGTVQSSPVCAGSYQRIRMAERTPFRNYAKARQEVN